MTNTSANQGGGQGFPSVDLLRGFVMLLFALDIMRYFIIEGFVNPVNLETTNVGLFFTRWITHFFAPGFLLLAGTVAYFKLKAGMSKKQLSLFLLIRGLFLILLEVIVIGFLWRFEFNIYPIFFQVIWVLGLSMVALAGLIWLPIRAVFAISLIVIFGHNMLDGLNFGDGYWQNIMNGVLHEEAVICANICAQSSRESFLAFISYPLLPWAGVMGLGYALGSLYQMAVEKRRKILIYGGLGATVLFLVVRAINGYGNPAPWVEQKNFLWTVMSFLNTEKYPPSLSYLLMTLGPAMLFLAWFEKAKGYWATCISTFGRVPLFYYVFHMLLAHALAMLLGIFQGYSASDFMVGFWRFPEEFGLSLFGVYGLWLASILVLYPICDWYADQRARKPDSLLRFF